MRIRVEPDVLRALSRQIQYAAEQIQQKMAVLDQAIHSLDWDIESRAAVMSEWERSKRLGEDALLRLMDLSVQLGRKALLFQQVDMEYRSVLSHVNVAYGNAVNMLNVLQSSSAGEILPAHAADVAVVSDPLSAMAAVYRIQDTAPPDGSPATLVQAMQPEPVAWRFRDPSFRDRRGTEPVVS
ncbi:WXG100 family type VII secretion target [Paenibacillus barcinonensis]|uniref:WXG100 family type VII secretion target n=1 Tax=Paenibacillus barcinonensis TaxID=198119 RepID=A0A2V4VPQ0_PAEBA|nr:WXG100 family type VII secretion target [Paenibacillus barcinonensis]PYE52089.1 hypothetical protein DFQ00_10121 [Paenibacillus barcinonensis]QKS59763.1 WXG100 family type VII secretion target [Paenibacillus barcinonensis]